MPCKAKSRALKASILAGLLAPLLCGLAAAVPLSFNVQGRLTDSNGVNKNGTVDLTFRIYSHSTSSDLSALRWVERKNGLRVVNGNFQALVGAGRDAATPEQYQTLAEVMNGDPVFLEFQAAGETPMLPRQQLVSVPYAIRAQSADNAPSGVPTGTILLHGAETPPPGFLECDGRALSPADHPGLFAALGTRFGGDGLNAFRLPDLRGVFPRGWNHGATGDFSDPAAAGRGMKYTGGATGDQVGSYQMDNVGPHHHGDFPTFALHQTVRSNGREIQAADPAAETRPRNVYLMFIIKI